MFDLPSVVTSNRGHEQTNGSAHRQSSGEVIRRPITPRVDSNHPRPTGERPAPRQSNEEDEGSGVLHLIANQNRSETIFGTYFPTHHFSNRLSNITLPHFPGPPNPPYTEYDVPGKTIPRIVLEETPPEYINPINPSTTLSAYDTLLQYDDRCVEALIERVENEILKQTMEMFAMKRLKKELASRQEEATDLHQALRDTAKEVRFAMSIINRPNAVKKIKKAEQRTSYTRDKISQLESLMEEQNNIVENAPRSRKRKIHPPDDPSSETTKRKRTKKSDNATLPAKDKSKENSIENKTKEKPTRKATVRKGRASASELPDTIPVGEAASESHEEPHLAPPAKQRKGKSRAKENSEDTEKPNKKSVSNRRTAMESSEMTSSSEEQVTQSREGDSEDLEGENNLLSELLEGSEELEKLLQGA